MIFAPSIHCKCRLFVRKDLELMRKSQGGKTTWQKTSAGVHGNNNNNKIRIQPFRRGQKRRGTRKHLKLRGGKPCDYLIETRHQDWHLSYEFTSGCYNFTVSLWVSCVPVSCYFRICLWLCVLKQCSSMGQLCLFVCMCLIVWLHSSLGLPPQHRGWLRLWEEGEGCKECDHYLCPPVPDDCPAGRVQDDCGCCEQCANVEGQLCDLDGAQKFYGRCGEGLVCQRKIPKREHRAEPEPACVCQDKGFVCGSDGWTYPNVCQLREAASRRNTSLRLTGRGPCYSGYCTLFFHMLSFLET